MSDEELTEEPKKKKTGLVIAVVSVVNILAIVGVVVFVLGGSDAEASGKGGEEAAEESGPPSGTPGPVIKMDSFIVNIESKQGSRYLKAGIAVELKNEESKTSFEASRLLMRNEILMFLSSLKVEDTLKVKQKQAIETKLKELLNKRIKSSVVVGVYFTEFVTQ